VENINQLKIRQSKEVSISRTKQSKICWSWKFQDQN